MQREHFHQKTENKDTFYQLSVTNAKCVVSCEKYPDVELSCDYQHEKTPKRMVKLSPVLDFWLQTRLSNHILHKKNPKLLKFINQIIEMDITSNSFSYDITKILRLLSLLK